MNADTAQPTAAGPQSSEARRTYEQRVQTLTVDEARLRRSDRATGIAKLLIAVVAFALGLWLARQHPRALAWDLIPVLLFAALWVSHERLLRQLRRTRSLREFYSRGLDRLNDAWAGKGDNGARFFDAEHLYARDLDLFGEGSLFELLSQARSVPGQATLASWLRSPAAPDAVADRQSAVRELVPRIDLRERLALTAEAIESGTPEILLAWANTPPAKIPARMLWIALPLAALWLATLFYWMGTGRVTWFVLLCVVNGIVNARSFGDLRHRAEQTLPISPMLPPLRHVLTVLEAEMFTSAALVRLRAHAEQGQTPSRSVAQLERTLHWLESSDNFFVRIADRFVFYTPLCMISIERWRARHRDELRTWIASVGEFEALSSLAGFAYEHPACTYPDLRDGAPQLVARGLRHPLLPEASAVPNDLQLSPEHALLIVSGPNMAGKSTLLRAIGLNVVLAQCGAPVCCGNLQLTPLAIGASIQVQDSLQGGLSRFYAEIRRHKQIVDVAADHPTLYLLDELLSGTNSHDRRVGTEALLHSLLARHAIGIITTHDLALTEIAEQVGGRASNVHFGDQFAGGALHFDYRLTPGIANSTNALALMRSIGLEVEG